jgi:hypothetical protein
MTPIEQLRKLPEDVKIGSIIYSFKTFALGDIEYNITKPIAAFILGSCFIDQMAAYRYNHGTTSNEEHYKKFINEYLKEYNSFDLYNNLRCLIIHNYTLGEYMSLTAELQAIDQQQDVLHANVLTARRFHSALSQAFAAFSKDILEVNSQARINAINRYNEAPVLVLNNYEIPVYSESDADYLISYFSKKVIGQTINYNDSLQILELRKSSIQQGVFKVEVLTKKKHRAIVYAASLADITQQLGLIAPIEVLAARLEDVK